MRRTTVGFKSISSPIRKGITMLTRNQSIQPALAGLVLDPGL